MESLFEKKLKSEIIFQGELIDLRRDEVLLPDGNIGLREYINHPGAVCCVPLLPDGRVLFIKQYRYAINSEIIELPAGKIDKNESPECAARREIEEEIGYKSKELTLLTKIYPAVGFANEIMWIYLSQSLEKSIPRTDEDEFIIVLPLNFEKAMSMIWNGQIRDAKSIIALQWANRFLKK